MDRVIIRKLDDDVIEAYRRRAKAKKRSLEEELREQLRRGVRPDPDKIFAEIDRIHRVHGPKKKPSGKPPLGVDLIREDRES
jgi:plasmid stability protein